MKHAGVQGEIHSFELGAFCSIHSAKGVKIPWESSLDTLWIEQVVGESLWPPHVWAAGSSPCSSLSLALASRWNSTCALLGGNEGCPAPPCSSLFPTPCNSMESFSLQHNSAIPVLNASDIKEVMWCCAETGTLCFHQAQSSAVATCSFLSLV